jgi:hypothetical protein
LESRASGRFIRLLYVPVLTVVRLLCFFSFGSLPPTTLLPKIFLCSPKKRPDRSKSCWFESSYERQHEGDQSDVAIPSTSSKANTTGATHIPRAHPRGCVLLDCRIGIVIQISCSLGPGSRLPDFVCRHHNIHQENMADMEDRPSGIRRARNGSCKKLDIQESWL